MAATGDRDANETAEPPRAAPGEPWSWRSDGARAAIIFALAFAVFANSIPNGFVYDDVPVIQENLRLSSPWNLKAFFGTSYWGDQGADQSLYRPLTIMSFAVDRALFGPGPTGVHAMNVLANALVAVLLYALLRLVCAGRIIPFVAALLFSIHPVHTEVVANGVGRAELYAAMFMLLAALFHFEFLWPSRSPAPRTVTRAERRRGEAPVAPRESRGKRNLVLALALYFVAMLFKESAVLLPGLLFVLDWLLVEKGRFAAVRARLPRYFAYVAPLLIYFAIRYPVVGDQKPVPQEVFAPTTAVDRMLFASEVQLRYLGQLLVPIRLCAEYSDYTDPVRRSVTDPVVAASLLCWLVIGAAVWWCVRRRSFVVPAAVAWFALAILPTSNLLFPIATIRADRLLFVPSIGFVLAVAWALSWLASRNRALGFGVIAVVLAGYAYRTIIRNLDWRDRESLWRATVAEVPGSALAWMFVGDIHKDRGEREQAEAAYQRAFTLRDTLGFAPEAHNKYAQMLVDRGDKAGAISHYRLVIEKQPKQHTALTNLGEILLHDAATRDEAITLLARATQVKPSDFMSHANLAQAYRLQGRNADAASAIDNAVKAKPSDPELWEIKAEVLRACGRASEAQAADAEVRRLRGR